MSRLEDLEQAATVRGIVPDALVTVVNTQWFGSEALELTYKIPEGKVANQLLYRHDEPRIEVVEQGRPWSFDGDGARFAWSPRPIASASPLSSTPCWPSTRPSSSRCRTRSPRSGSIR